MQKNIFHYDFYEYLSLKYIMKNNKVIIFDFCKNFKQIMLEKLKKKIDSLMKIKHTI